MNNMITPMNNNIGDERQRPDDVLSSQQQRPQSLRGKVLILTPSPDIDRVRLPSQLPDDANDGEEKKEHSARSYEPKDVDKDNDSYSYSDTNLSVANSIQHANKHPRRFSSLSNQSIGLSDLNRSKNSSDTLEITPNTTTTMTSTGHAAPTAPQVEITNMDEDLGNESFHSLSTIGGSVNTGAGSTTGGESTEKMAAFSRLLGNRETRQIWCLKGVALIAFLVATCMVSVVIFYSTRQSEQQQAQAMFYERSSNLVEEFLTNLQHGAIMGLNSLAVSYTTMVKQPQGQEWPYVILPEFSVRASSTRKLANAAMISFVPRVEHNQRRDWEVFSTSESATKWINQGLALENVTQSSDGTNSDDTTRRKRSLLIQSETNKHIHRNRKYKKADKTARPLSGSSRILVDAETAITTKQPVEFSSTNGVATSIYRIVETSDDGNQLLQFVIDETIGPYYPIWQNSPVHPKSVNFNVISHKGKDNAFLGEELQLAMYNEQIVFGRCLREEDLSVFDQVNDNMKLQDRQDEPVSMFFFPVLDSFEKNESNTESQQQSRQGRTKPLGSLTALVYWKDYLEFTTSVESPNAWSPSPLASSTDSNFFDVVCVLVNECDQAYSFEVLGSGDVIFLGEGDQHDSSLNDEYDEVSVDIGAFFDELQLQTKENGMDITSYEGISVNNDYCPYKLYVYPTTAMQQQFLTNRPLLYTGLVVAIFVLTAIVFFAYDAIVERRQRKVMKKALKSHEIVYSLFPENVRNRLFEEENSAPQNTGTEDKGKTGRFGNASVRDFTPFQDRRSSSMGTGGSGGVYVQRGNRVKRYLDGGGANTSKDVSKPIADLFPHTTVLFADIAGFTAWSSVRDPGQVFTLLESVYAAFDKLATRRRVFKVETIGDCYVAVTGLPNPQPDHAVIMVKFARDCLVKMEKLTRNLEVELGPDTGELCIRIGLHSGPVTAGVLRGQKSRFQLFGDTVNTASRMESTGVPNQIQCSQQTAELLTYANKAQWITPRRDVVHAKGKGIIQTYWVVSKASHGPDEGSVGSVGSVVSDDEDLDDDDGYEATPVKMASIRDVKKKNEDEDEDNDVAEPPMALRLRRSDISPHLQRLIHWNVDMLAKLLKVVIAGRMNIVEKPKPITKRASRVPSLLPSFIKNGSDNFDGSRSINFEQIEPKIEPVNCPREEYAEAVSLPRFDHTKGGIKKVDPDTIELDAKVKGQLRDYVTTIACAYNDNPFHNFEHASHVTMSANKILKRVVEAEHCEVRRASMDNLASRLHDYTYGITSDPLTHFACVFSAMIHDVDHPGVPNSQLIKEDHEMAQVYNNESIAEQNSFDFAWELLMDPIYEDLRKCIYINEEELKRFRQLVVNSLMATDVFDKDLVALRNSRWEKAFSIAIAGSEDTTDLKATIVIEHIIQAADVAHTMQHWHVYQKWNRRLFEEMHAAYKSGRGTVDPSVGWYKGELWFYDNYIIPLARKLKECGVFGASSDEFLTYAMDNRSEWEAKGERLVEDMLSGCIQQSEDFK